MGKLYIGIIVQKLWYYLYYWLICMHPACMHIEYQSASVQFHFISSFTTILMALSHNNIIHGQPGIWFCVCLLADLCPQSANHGLGFGVPSYIKQPAAEFADNPGLRSGRWNTGPASSAWPAAIQSPAFASNNHWAPWPSACIPNLKKLWLLRFQRKFAVADGCLAWIRSCGAAACQLQGRPKLIPVGCLESLHVFARYCLGVWVFAWAHTVSKNITIIDHHHPKSSDFTPEKWLPVLPLRCKLQATAVGQKDTRAEVLHQMLPEPATQPSCSTCPNTTTNNETARETNVKPVWNQEMNSCRGPGLLQELLSSCILTAVVGNAQANHLTEKHLVSSEAFAARLWWRREGHPFSNLVNHTLDPEPSAVLCSAWSQEGSG